MYWNTVLDWHSKKQVVKLSKLHILCDDNNDIKLGGIPD